MEHELNYKDLKRFSVDDINKLGYSSFDEIVPLNGLIGQEKAASALEYGLAVKNKGYNIYISGQKGCGRTSFAVYHAKKQAESEPVPNDLCYVYNFKEPRSPLLLSLEPGRGVEFKNDMEELCEQIKTGLIKEISSHEFEDEKNELLKRYQTARDDVVSNVQIIAKERGFGVKMTNSGLFFMPIIDGEPLSEEQFEALSDDEKKDLNSKSDEIQEEAAVAMYDMKECERKTKKAVSELEYRSSLFVIGKHIGKLMKKYDGNDVICSYLMAAKEDMLDNAGEFTDDEDEDDEATQSMMPWVVKKISDSPLGRYRVNLFVDNSGISSAPVLIGKNPTYSILLGETEYDSEYGNLSTDYMKIRAGLLHRANGGYLILQEEDVLGNYAVWDLIKKTAKTGEAIIEPLKEFTTGIAISGVKPGPVKLDIKFIIVGSYIYYEMLSAYDNDFRKLFRINALFDNELKYDKDIESVIRFIRRFADDEKLPGFDMAAISTIVENYVRLAENKNKITANFDHMQELLVEAAYHARMEGSATITPAHVKKALQAKENRSNLYEEKLSELIETSVIMIDTEGMKIGQINGLSVITTGDSSFGKPSRITATTYIGKSGVINIEKEADMSGSIHDKGIEVISGYLGQMYAQDFPLSLSCRVCFEQNYGGIDGDSASSTELYAILSSLSGLPIRQDIAVTGSVNQRGEIQAIGGVNEKIEGFFELCETRLPLDTRGVIIPAQNVGDLMLKDEVIEAVRNNKFHIYAIKSIDEGLEILTGKKAGQKNSKGEYPQNSIHGRALKKLKYFHGQTLETQAPARICQ